MNQVDQYISSFPADIQKILNKVRQLALSAHPDTKEAMKYNMPTYVLKKNIFHFAANKNHLGIYPTPAPIEHFKEELKGFQTSKGAIQFPYNETIPYDLIARILEFQVKRMTV